MRYAGTYRLVTLDELYNMIESGSVYALCCDYGAYIYCLAARYYERACRVRTCGTCFEVMVPASVAARVSRLLRKGDIGVDDICEFA